MATLNALKRAPILNQDGVHIGGDHVVTTSNPTVAALSQAYGNYQWWVVGVKGGTATITATRNTDGAVATLEVDVLAAAPFSIALGAEQDA